MNNKAFTTADKRPFCKVLELIAKQCKQVKVGDSESETICLNLHLEEFTPYAVDKRTCRDLLDGVLHSLDVTMIFPNRVRRNAPVEVSTADIFYNLVENIPNYIRNNLDNLETADQR